MSDVAIIVQTADGGEWYAGAEVHHEARSRVIGRGGFETALEGQRYAAALARRIERVIDALPAGGDLDAALEVEWDRGPVAEGGA